MLLQSSDAARERGTNPFLYQKCHLQAERGLGQETPVESLLTQYLMPVRRSRIQMRWKNKLMSDRRRVKPLAAAEE